jgi:hypothetical protein
LLAIDITAVYPLQAEAVLMHFSAKLIAINQAYKKHLDKRKTQSEEVNQRL